MPEGVRRDQDQAKYRQIEDKTVFASLEDALERSLRMNREPGAGKVQPCV